MNREWIESNKSKLSELQKHRMSSGNHQFQCKEIIEKAIHNRFLAYGYKIAYLYYAKLEGVDDKYKIGISGDKTLKSRTSYRNYHLINLVLLYEGPVEKVLTLERTLVKLFCTTGELITSDRLPEVIEFISRY